MQSQFEQVPVIPFSYPSTVDEKFEPTEKHIDAHEKHIDAHEKHIDAHMKTLLYKSSPGVSAVSSHNFDSEQICGLNRQKLPYSGDIQNPFIARRSRCSDRPDGRIYEYKKNSDDSELAGIGYGSFAVYQALFPERGATNSSLDTDICCMRHLANFPGLFSKAEVKKDHSMLRGGLLRSKQRFQIERYEYSDVKLRSLKYTKPLLQKSSNVNSFNEDATQRTAAPPQTSILTQHPIIQAVTPLIPPRHFTQILKCLDSIPAGLSDDMIIPLHFIAGLAHFKLGNYSEATVRFSKCVDLCTPNGDRGRGNIALCNIYLGDVEFTNQRYLPAATHYKKATLLYSTNNVAALFRMVPPSLSAVHAKCGSALRNGSKMVDAVQEYKAAIEKALTDKDRLAANTSLGNLYQSLGENQKALTHYENCVALSEKLLDYVSLGWAHGNMGNAYLGLLQKDKALHHLQKSLDLTVEHEPTPQAIGRTYNNLGTAFQSLGELDKAQEYYDHALSQAIYGDDLPGQARVYGNIGNVLMLRKTYSEAIPHYGEVLRLSKDRSTISTAHHNRGCAYYEWAETKMEDLAKSRAATTPPFYVHGPDFTDPTAPTRPRIVIPDIAKYYRNGSEDLQEVVKYHEENLDNIKGSSKGLSLSISLFETNSRTFHRLQDCLVNLGEYTRALQVAEQSRARTLGELMLKRKGWSLPHQLQSPFPFDQIAKIIGSKTNPVLYLSYTGARLLGWVFVPKDGGVKMNMFEVPLKDDQFDGKSFDYHLRYTLTDTLVERSFEMYRGVNYDKESSQPVQYLYSLIAEPLFSVLRKHTDLAEIHKIVVVSDSYTSLLPYCCLHDPEQGFLGDRVSFQLMPSLLTMGVMDQLPDANVVRLPADAQGMCIVGNPNVPQFLYNKEVWNLGKLPHAKREAEWVSHILKTTPILEEQATKTALLMRIMSAKVIHLATHGSASAGFLAFGAMASIGNDKVVDAKSVLLYPEDVEELNISPALVVLSSCDSARGTVKADGIQGMARAFILAGAQAVLTTLWRVPDESAAVFMQFFYQYMVDGMESTLALRKAILSIRCFSKYSQYIHWSGYQLTGRDVHFKTTPSDSTHILLQRLGPGTVFPRLKFVKALEGALVNNPCYPTDVQILEGGSGVKPSEVVVDFIHSCHQYFIGGIFWINCECAEFISACVHYIEQVTGSDLEHLPVLEGVPVLFVLDSLTSLPTSQPLLDLMAHKHAHFVLLYTHYHAPDQLIRAIDHQLLRGTTVHNIEPLTMIHSTQRTVYTIQQELDLAPNGEDQDILEKLAEFTSGSPVLVDITTQIILAHLVKNQPQGPGSFEDTSHKSLKEFAKSISLDTTRAVRKTSNFNFVMREISPHMKKFVSNLVSDQRDEWDTKCKYDSWDSISELLSSCELGMEGELLLNCLSIFGANPIPKGLVTTLSSLICRTSGNPHLATSLLHMLTRLNFVQVYPLPVVIHSSVKLSDREAELVCVPQYIANFLWKAMDDSDKVIALATSYLALSNLPSSPQYKHFLLGLTAILLEAFELNSDLLGEEYFRQCHEKVFAHYVSLM